MFISIVLLFFYNHNSEIVTMIKKKTKQRRRPVSFTFFSFFIIRFGWSNAHFEVGICCANLSNRGEVVVRGHLDATISATQCVMFIQLRFFEDLTTCVCQENQHSKTQVVEVFIILEQTPMSGNLFLFYNQILKFNYNCYSFPLL